MTGRIRIPALAAFRRREDGASLVEYTIVISLFLLVFFAILDFGRLGFNWVMTEKAMQRAARIATVRPPVCASVPESYALGSDASASFGTLCRAGANMCASGGTQQCVLAAAAIDCAAIPGTPQAATAQEIWCILEPILPSNATPQNIRLSYRYDANLGFAGGPYTPIIEVGVVTAAHAVAIGGAARELRFEFITPLPALAALAGGGATTNFQDNDTDSLADIPFPDLSVSLPGEDLNHGTDG